MVDDYVETQVLTKFLLEKMDCQVDVAEDGLEALEMWGKTDYDAILMDVQLPELDGYETTRRIRKSEISGKRTPIIALTANALEGDREKCLKAGMDDYVAKPFRGEDIEKVLQKLLPES